MPNRREQLGVRVSLATLERLARLQVHYGQKSNLERALSQSDAVEVVIKVACEVEGLPIIGKQPPLSEGTIPTAQPRKKKK